MVLLIVSLMVVVGAFLMNSVTGYYINDFYQQLADAFGLGAGRVPLAHSALRLGQKPSGLLALLGLLPALQSIRREYELVKTLASARGQAVSRESLMEQVWNYDGYVGDVRAVDVAIRRLREKLELVI